jgi:hypothetical protein
MAAKTHDARTSAYHRVHLNKRKDHERPHRTATKFQAKGPLIYFAYIVRNQVE